MVHCRNSSVIDFSNSSYEHEIQEESSVPSPPPRRSLSKRGRGFGRIEEEGPSRPYQPSQGGRQKVSTSLSLAGEHLSLGVFLVKRKMALWTTSSTFLLLMLFLLGASVCIKLM
jgi:hypothetical protein